MRGIIYVQQLLAFCPDMGRSAALAYVNLPIKPKDWTNLTVESLPTAQ